MDNGPFKHMLYNPETDEYYDLPHKPATVEEKLDRIIALLEGLLSITAEHATTASKKAVIELRDKAGRDAHS